MAEPPGAGTANTGSDDFSVQRSSRDPEELRAGLEQCFRQRLAAAASPRVADIATTSANGMSSETVLFEASWQEADQTRNERLVARIAPAEADLPVFPSYDLQRQFDAIRLVGELTSVPVPRMWWYEPEPDAIGAPFFVMERIDGLVPPDVMPYSFGDNWLFDAPQADQRRLQESTVDVLARLHAIADPEERFAFLAFDDQGETALRRHVAHTQAFYAYATAGGMRSKLIERGFRWLEDNWPKDEGPTVLSWGDSRIGNMMFRDFEPVAVLDWEMAALGPRELDLGWLIFAHQVFESLADMMGLPGMPHFLRADDVAASYEQLTGRTPRHLRWYLTYAAVQWGIVFLRTGARQVHFGEIDEPADADDLLHHRPLFERLLTA